MTAAWERSQQSFHEAVPEREVNMVVTAHKRVARVRSGGRA
ncbi:MAG TPA: hypothetical protein VMA72_06100 [Streptosporangiaceae bacterium]|nr:hypothetical protein [Streptosporangiaceae bacterium]